MKRSGTLGFLEWAVVARAHDDALELGDAYVVLARPDGSALVGVVDGLGHGKEAEQAATRAREVLASRPGLELEQLFRECHASLRGTRGVAMSLATVHPTGEVRWLAVGNVEGLLVRSERGARRDYVLLRGGVVGYQLPTLRTSSQVLGAGDVLIFASDGIEEGFVAEVDPARSVADIAEGIFVRSSKETDDALVLVLKRQ